MLSTFINSYDVRTRFDVVLWYYRHISLLENTALPNFIKSFKLWSQPQKSFDKQIDQLDFRTARNESRVIQELVSDLEALVGGSLNKYDK